MTEAEYTHGSYESIRRIGVLSMHTSPLDQPGLGDSGGLNVYVRELAASMATQGIAVMFMFVERQEKFLKW